VKLRCVLDGLELPAQLLESDPALLAWDGHEGFMVESLEALYYELVSATWAEVAALHRARYRLLRRADDFRWDD
jgi:hypothetical protein